MGKDQPFRCAFCDRTQEEVKRLVASRQPGVFICNNCVELCADLLDEQGLSAESIASASEAKLMSDIQELKENVRQSISAIMENRLATSHLISDVEALLEYVGKLEAILGDSRSD